MLTALAGGVGAARFLSGLVHAAPDENITVIVNTGDDINFHGLHVSPDIDIVAYTLAGIVDEEKGWGIKGDTFHCLEMLRIYGYETWFNVGDKDLATHLHRSNMLRKGLKLSEVTADMCRRLGLKVKILPMTDDKFETWILTDAGLMHFQEYLVKRSTRDRVLDVKFFGVETAQPAPGVIDAITESEMIIVCPSNPIVSIGTILSLKGVRESLRRSRAHKVAVSPIVGGAPIKGPADKMMSALGLEVSSYSIAKLYSDFLDTFVLDVVDEKEKKRVEELGINVIVTNTVMRNFEDKIRLAKTILDEIRKMSQK